MLSKVGKKTEQASCHDRVWSLSSDLWSYLQEELSASQATDLWHVPEVWENLGIGA